MKNGFVQTSNVKRFVLANTALEDRGAPEASIMLATGKAGCGKSRTGQWYQVQNDAARVRLKKACTPHWFLTDLVKELGESPAFTCEKLFNQAIEALVKGPPRPIVVDEVEHGIARDLAVVETIRDIVDLTEATVVMIGREFVPQTLKRHKQIWTRVSALAEFTRATIDDVAKCCDELAEVEITEAVVEKIHDQAEGRIRSVVNAIKNCERVGLRHKGEAVSVEMMAGVPLCQE